MCRNNEAIVVDLKTVKIEIFQFFWIDCFEMFPDIFKTVKIEIFQFFWIDCFEMFPDIFKRVLHFKLIMFRKFQ
jgi:hypothetical protein